MLSVCSSEGGANAAIRKFYCTVILVVVLLGAGCAAPGAGQALTVENPFVRPFPSEGGNGGAFMTIINAGRSSDRLISATSAAAQTVELHETTEEGGVMKMRPVPGRIEVPANGRLGVKARRQARDAHWDRCAPGGGPGNRSHPEFRESRRDHGQSPG